MVNWALYDSLLGNGEKTNSRQRSINDALYSFANSIVDDPAYQADAIVNGVETPIVASPKSTNECLIKALPDTDIHLGDEVECLGEHWLVVELFKDKLGVINGTMWLCNDILRFQNNSSAVHSRHCVVDDGTYSKRSSDPNAFIMANTYKVYAVIDEETQKLFVDKRLGFGQIYSSSGEKVLEVYKIIGIDTKTKNHGEGSHLMVITVQRDVYDGSVDSLEDNLCDIFVESDDIANPVVTGSCGITGRDSIRAGATRKYTGIFTDANGQILTDIFPVWEVITENGVEYSVNGKELVVTAPLSENVVGTVVTIRLTDETGMFGQYEKKVQVVAVG